MVILKKLPDEEEAFLCQWDTGRDVIITPEDGFRVDAIEFWNETTELAPEGIIREEDGLMLSEIPNDFLQSSNRIRVYLVMNEENGRRTVDITCLTVIPRAKPADYVYKSTEIKSWHALEERLKKLEETQVDSEAVANAVKEYLAENPIQIDVPKKLSDLQGDKEHRTVTDEEKQTWNGKLDSSKLQEAVNEALAQAKASGEFDGADGITPRIGVNGNWFIGETDTGVLARGQNGYTPVKGKDYFDGKDGKTPEKGVDYFTDADKTAFVQDVLNALPTWQGGAF